MNSKTPITPPPEQPWNSASVLLRIVAGPHEGEERRFHSPTRLIVGRGRDAPWRLAKDRYLSRQQFRIEYIPPTCRLVNLASTSPTRVNELPAESVILRDTDRIQCGETVFAVTITAAPDQADTPTLEVPPEKRIDPSAPPAPLFPRQIAEFELTRELARGGMGVVYHAFQRPSGREAAVKTILPTTEVTTEAIQRFIRGASILARLRHRRIVECLGLGLHEAEMYFAMEYLPIIDFSEYLNRQQPAKRIRSACGVICRVLEALQYAHEQDIVHRDVKPSNILVYRTGAALQVKLADFGLAKNYESAGFTVISCDNAPPGTLAFAAPEQKKDSRYAKPSCDIYSTGATLYYWLSNTLPLAPADGKNGSSPLVKPLPLADRAPDVPKELAGIVDRSLATDPAARFSSAEHMRRALVKFSTK